MSRRCLILLCCFFCSIWFIPTPGFCEVTVGVTVSPEEGTVQDTFTVEISFSGTQAGGIHQPQFEENKDFEVTPFGSQTQHSIVNGAASFTMTYRYQLVPRHDLPSGTYKIPRGFLVIGGSRTYLRQPEIQIAKESTSGSPDAAKHGVDFTQLINNTKPYVGQQVLYEAQVITGTQLYNPDFSDPEFTGFWRESYDKTRELHKSYAGQNFTVFVLTEALFPTAPGAVTIPARSFTADIPVRKSPQRRISPFDSFFDLQLNLDSVYNLAKKRFVAEPISLDAQPLPPPPMTNTNIIPVGTVSAYTSVDKVIIPQGESATLSIELEGNANLRAYELPPLNEQDARDFKLYSDKPDLNVSYGKSGVTFKKKFSLALVPKRAGNLDLPVFTIITFDPEAKEYRMLATEKKTLTVTPSLTTEQLVVRGAQEGIQTDKPVDQRQDINSLSEDLLPQRATIGAWQTNKPLSISVIVALFLLLPFLSMTYRWKLLAANRKGDPLELLRLGAYQKAKSGIDTLEQEISQGSMTAQQIDKLSSTLTRFLGEKFLRAGESLTPIEAGRLVKEKTQNQETQEQVERLLKDLERYRFGGSLNTSLEQGKQLIATLRAIIEKIEQTVPLRIK